MTNQEIFDKVVAHLREQGEPSYSEFDDGCRYRYMKQEQGKQNKLLKCAAGCLISDEEYKLEFEGGSIKIDILQTNEITQFFRSRYESCQIELIRQLQDVHDGGLNSVGISPTMDDWERGFKNIAKDFNLIYIKQ